MKKIGILGMFLGLLLAACQENEMNGFDSEGAVYFQLSSQWSNTVDSIVYSFAGKAEDTYTVKLQVNLMGAAADHDRTVRLAVDKNRTTAVEGTHYEALQASYTLPAGAYTMEIPVVLLGNDPELEERAFQIALKLEASDDLQLGLSKRTTARVIVSKLLTKPSYWEDAYMDYYFGPYSKVKHEHFILVLGKDFPATLEEYGAEYDLWSAYGQHMDKYFTDHYPILDEYGNPIEPWN